MAMEPLPNSAITAQSRCPSCGAVAASGAFCAGCGESLHAAQHLRLGHFLHEAFHFQTHLDNKVVRTLKPLILQPGLLTQAWLQGQRQPYAKPIQLFVVLNLVFFLLASTLGVQLIAVDANSVRLGMPGLSVVQLEAQRARLGLSPEHYAWAFNLALEPHKKWLFLLWMGLIAAVMQALHPRRALVGHLVFAIHFSCLLFLYLVLLGMVQAVALQTPWGLIPNYILLAVSLVLLGSYAAIAVRRVVQVPWWRAVLEGLLVTASFLPAIAMTERLSLQLAYRALGT